jgi:hypothetical protein
MHNETLYAYLNINHPMVAWEVAIGRIRSACDLGMEAENFGISLWQYNLLRRAKDGASKRFLNELKLEKTRQNVAPDSVSRLRGVYFFESERDAYAAIERWRIPQNKHYITAVNFSANKTTRVDSEWITSYLLSDESDWMQRYWAGETLGQKPLIEVLASGIGLVQSAELREAAYRSVLGSSPEATPLLSMAACAFKHARLETLAQTVPGVIKCAEGIKIDFYIYIDDLNANEELIKKSVEACMKLGEMPPMIRPNNPEVFFSLPDYRDGSFMFTDAAISQLYEEVHASIHEA